MRRRSAVTWGAFVALLGIFMMHGASASAAPGHCGDVRVMGHVHATPSVGHQSSVGTQDQTPALASIGVPLPRQAGDVGGLCVAILMAGVLVLLSHRAATTFDSQGSRRLVGTATAFVARAPPGPRRSELSIWRN